MKLLFGDCNQLPNFASFTKQLIEFSLWKIIMDTCDAAETR